MGRVTGALFVVLVCIPVSTLPVTAPSGQDEISVDRAAEHIDVMAATPHPMGSPENALVRDYLVATLQAMGLHPQIQTATAPDYFGVPGGTVEIANVIARIGGSEHDGALLLIAHYDTVPDTPGANDNAAAVAALLEVGRVLSVDPPSRDVILLFTDGEEPTPRFGASAFVEHEWFDDVELAANFEGIGTAGPSLLVEFHGPGADLAERLAGSTGAPTMFSALTRTSELIGGAATDFDVIRSEDVPGYNFAYLRGSAIYHTERDIPASLNVAGMAHHAALALGLARDSTPIEADDGGGETVFFTLPGRRVIRYGGLAAVGSLVLAAGLTGWGLLRDLRRQDSTVGGLLRGSALVVGGGLAVAILATVAWIGIANQRPTMGVAEGYLWLAGLLAVVGGGWYLVRRFAHRPDVAGGTGLLWALLAILTGIWLAPMSYLFVWPAVAYGLVGIIAPKTSRGRNLGVALVGLMAALILTPVVDTFFQLATPRPGNPDSDLTAAIAVPLLIVFLAVALVDTATGSATDYVSSRMGVDVRRPRQQGGAKQVR